MTQELKFVLGRVENMFKCSSYDVFQCPASIDRAYIDFWPVHLSVRRSVRLSVCLSAIGHIF